MLQNLFHVFFNLSFKFYQLKSISQPGGRVAGSLFIYKRIGVSLSLIVRVKGDIPLQTRRRVTVFLNRRAKGSLSLIDKLNGSLSFVGELKEEFHTQLESFLRRQSWQSLYFLCEIQPFLDEGNREPSLDVRKRAFSRRAKQSLFLTSEREPLLD